MPFASLFGIGDVLEAIVKNADKHHGLQNINGKEREREENRLVTLSICHSSYRLREYA